MSRKPGAQLAETFVGFPLTAFRGRGALLWGIPGLAGCALGALTWRLPLNIAGERGLIDATLPLLGLLVGFFVAGLGTVVALTSARLDVVPDNPPRRRGEPLSLRTFLSKLFGYLVAVTITAHIFGVAVLVATPAAASIGGLASDLAGVPAQTFLEISRACVAMIFSATLVQILGVTLLGLYFIAARIPEIVATDTVPIDPDALEELERLGRGAASEPACSDPDQPDSD